MGVGHVRGLARTTRSSFSRSSRGSLLLSVTVCYCLLLSVTDHALEPQPVLAGLAEVYGQRGDELVPRSLVAD